MTERSEKITKSLRFRGLSGMKLNKEVRRLQAKHNEILKTKEFKDTKDDQSKVFTKRRKKHKEFLKKQKDGENQSQLEDFDEGIL